MSKRRCITVLLCLLTASVVTASFFLIPEFRSRLTGLLMLFSQRSVQSLQGAINASAFPFFYAAFLSFIQRFLCWFPPRQIIAAVFCLGIFPGMAASLAGGSAACLLCYFIGRLLPARLREKRLFGLCHWPGCKHDVFGVFRTCMLTIGCAPFIIACAYMGLLYRNAFRGCSVFSFMQSTQLVFTE